MPTLRPFLRLTFTACLSLILTLATRAQTPAPATGTIEGRVKNAVSGDYLNNARVTVKGRRGKAVVRLVRKQREVPGGHRGGLR